MSNSVLEHLGPRATVEITPPPPSVTGAAPAGAWHEDTYVAGPSWAEFQKAMDFTGSGPSVYVVSVHRPAPGHRTQLQDLLSRRDPESAAEGGVGVRSEGCSERLYGWSIQMLADDAASVTYKYPAAT